jgi:GAF domain/Sel1 repeat/PilZ domain
MDRSARSLSDPVTGPYPGERRRSIRQKLHTPVYASFNGPRTAMVVDLSELIDLHEEGFAVQTSQRLDVNQAVTVCLDLPETGNYIHCSGQVIWSDDKGRGGIHFSPLPNASRRILKEWLFSNLMIGCTNHAARVSQLASRAQLQEPETTKSIETIGTEDKSAAMQRPAESPVPAPTQASTQIPAQVPIPVPISDGSATLSAVEAVRLVIREIGDDLDKILQLVTERAVSFTGASGAALALRTADHTAEQMVCRARTGEPAPPLGTPVDVRHGISGECVRRGILISCEDTEHDARVDAELCRALGIGSLMAAPIMSGLDVVGLLEVFSPRPRAFTKTQETVLDRLVELIPHSLIDRNLDKHPPEGAPQTRVSREIGDTTSEPRPLTVQAAKASVREPQLEARQEVVEKVPDPKPAATSRLVYRALIGMVILVVFVVIGYLVGPIIDKRWTISSQASQRAEASDVVSAQRAADHNRQVTFLADLQKLAEEGNADAQWQLGARYHNGEDVPQDDIVAMQWFQRAAEQGHPTAQSALGAYYWAGRGVPQDLTKAYFWSTLALAQGDENSKGRLEGLASQMTKEQVTAARQQAEVWIRTHSERTKSASN